MPTTKQQTETAIPQADFEARYSNSGESSSGKSINFAQVANTGGFNNFGRTLFCSLKERSELAEKLRNASGFTIYVVID